MNHTKWAGLFARMTRNHVPRIEAAKRPIGKMKALSQNGLSHGSSKLLIKGIKLILDTASANVRQMEAVLGEKGEK